MQVRDKPMSDPVDQSNQTSRNHSILDALWGAYEGTRDWWRSLTVNKNTILLAKSDANNTGLMSTDTDHLSKEQQAYLNAKAEGLVNTSFFGRMGERFSSLFSGNGFDTKAENVLENILQPGKSNKSFVVTLADGSVIQKIAGQEGVTLKLNNPDGEPVKIKLQSTGDLKHLLEGASSFFGALGNINDGTPGLQWHSNNLKAYFSNFRYGSHVANMNGYGDTYYNYDNTIQSEERDPEMQARLARGEKFTFKEYHGYFSGFLSNALNCVFAAKINMLKSEGLIRPDATVYEVYDSMGKKSEPGNVFSQTLFMKSFDSDWAKLTGADQFQYGFVDLGRTGSDAGITYLKGGGTATIREENSHYGHFYNVANDEGKMLRIDPRRNLPFDVRYDATTGGIPSWFQRLFNYRVDGETNAWGLKKYQNPNMR
jgi:hypothetical protein